MPALKKKIDSKTVKRTATAAVVSLLSTILLCAVMSALINAGTIGEGGVRGCAIIALVIGAALGGFYAAQSSGEKYLLNALACGAGFVLLRLIISFLAEGCIGCVSQLEGALCILCGSALGSLPRKKKKRRKH